MTQPQKVAPEKVAHAIRNKPRKYFESWARNKFTDGGSWLATAPKDVLIKAIETGIAPNSVWDFGNTPKAPTAEPTEPPKAAEPKAQTAASADDRALQLAELLVGLMNSGAVIDEKTVRRLVSDEVTKATLPRRLEIKTPDTPDFTDVGLAHKQFPRLVEVASRKEEGPDGVARRTANIYLHGPAGTGKTEACRRLADLLKLEFYCQTFSGDSDKVDLLGFVDAHGNVVGEQFAEAWEKGGVFLADEADRGEILVALNTATSSIYCPLPGGRRVKRHADFVLVAAGNTDMRGTTRQYAKAVEQDGAARDRFRFIPWGVDERLETDICTQMAKGHKRESHVRAWLDRVRALRTAIDKAGAEQVEATPRASIQGTKDILCGDDLKVIEEELIWKGLDSRKRKQIEGKIEAA